MKRLIVIAGFVLVAACDSTPTQPSGGTRVQQPTTTPTPNPYEPGPVPIPGTTILAGETITVTVKGEDHTCFPNWDSNGRCRQFDVTMLADGLLTATVILPAPSRGVWNPDVFVVSPDGSWVQPDFGWPENRAAILAKEGASYRVVVLSYGPFPDVFQLAVKVG